MFRTVLVIDKCADVPYDQQHSQVEEAQSPRCVSTFWQLPPFTCLSAKPPPYPTKLAKESKNETGSSQTKRSKSRYLQLSAVGGCGGAVQRSSETGRSEPDAPQRWVPRTWQKAKDSLNMRKNEKRTTKRRKAQLLNRLESGCH